MAESSDGDASSAMVGQFAGAGKPAVGAEQPLIVLIAKDQQVAVVPCIRQ